MRVSLCIADVRVNGKPWLRLINKITTQQSNQLVNQWLIIRLIRPLINQGAWLINVND